MTRPAALTTVRVAFELADKLGAPIPEDVAAQYAKLTDAVDKVAAFKQTIDGRSSLAGCIIDALEAGADPASSPGVQEAVTRQAIKGLVDFGIDQELSGRLGLFLDEHVHAIVGSFAAPFAAAAETIKSARDKLGDVGLEDTADVLTKGDDAAQWWSAAQTADAAITKIANVWKSLSQVTSAVPFDRRFPAFIIAEIPAADFVDNGLITLRIRPWDIARSGWKLDYCSTVGEYQRRVATLRADAQRRQDEHAAAEKRAARNVFGFGVPEPEPPEAA
jgi:hypothetical protein